jgi:hypothetical protein
MLKLHHQHAHFFRPESVFEWKVYDYLLKSSEFTALHYEGLHADKTKTEFFLKSEEHSKRYSSNPDLIGEKESESYIIDVKWKLLDEPQEDDIQKLARDAKIRGFKRGILIYPMQEKDSKFKIAKRYNYSYDDDFSFEVRVIGL